MNWKLTFISQEDFTRYVRKALDNVSNDFLLEYDKENFHKGIFQYIADCHVPRGEEGGWGVIVRKDSGIILSDGDVVHTIYAEMKSKRSTMNSLTAIHSYLKMQSQLLEEDDCACFLIEIDEKQSHNIKWTITVDGKRIAHSRIRLISLDQFYALVTGQEGALDQIYMVLTELRENGMEICL